MCFLVHQSPIKHILHDLFLTGKIMESPTVPFCPTLHSRLFFGGRLLLEYAGRAKQPILKRKREPVCRGIGCQGQDRLSNYSEYVSVRTRRGVDGVQSARHAGLTNTSGRKALGAFHGWRCHEDPFVRTEATVNRRHKSDASVRLRKAMQDGFPLVPAELEVGREAF